MRFKRQDSGYAISLFRRSIKSAWNVSIEGDVKDS